MARLHRRVILLLCTVLEDCMETAMHFRTAHPKNLRQRRKRQWIVKFIFAEFKNRKQCHQHR
jgi:hypothetical protein